MQQFQENCLFKNNAYIALRPLVSLFGRLVACSARIVVTDRQTHTHTHGTTTTTIDTIFPSLYSRDWKQSPINTFHAGNPRSKVHTNSKASSWTEEHSAFLCLGVRTQDVPPLMTPRLPDTQGNLVLTTAEQ